ncbi:MAG: hypothetical protein KC477_15725, partial [Oceanospirillaceae bacterium]|nr:hypothetical protein [Oceanospirillaceae bacterium]
WCLSQPPTNCRRPEKNAEKILSSAYRSFFVLVIRMTQHAEGLDEAWVTNRNSLIGLCPLQRHFRIVIFT